MSSQTDYEDDEQFDNDNEGSDDGDASCPPQITAEMVASIDTMSPDDLELLIDDIDANEEWEDLKEIARDRANVFLKLKLANQAPRCSHVKPNGKHCGSPAVSGDTFCYFHGDARVRRKAAEEARVLDMPLLEDKLSVQMAVMHVCGLLANKTIDEKTARVMFYGLGIAQRNMDSGLSLPEL
jgi:hypothetical protein